MDPRIHTARFFLNVGTPREGASGVFAFNIINRYPTVVPLARKRDHEICVSYACPTISVGHLHFKYHALSYCIIAVWNGTPRGPDSILLFIYFFVKLCTLEWALVWYSLGKIDP